LLRLKHGEQIGSTLAVLKLRYLEGLSGSFYLPPEMNLGLAIVGHLAKRILHISISIKYGTQITRDHRHRIALASEELPHCQTARA
jgi:hypothetical protein